MLEYCIPIKIFAIAVVITAVPFEDSAITVAITVVWRRGLGVTIVSLIELIILITFLSVSHGYT